MASLEEKVKIALDESRMLVLGAQVLVGFGYRAAFERSFASLSPSIQYSMLGSLGILLVGVALLLSTGAYHRIVHKGQATKDMHSFATKVMDLALLPFLIALAVDLGAATTMLAGGRWGIAAGI